MMRHQLIRTLRDLHACASTHAPDVCLVGNVRAADIRCAMNAMLKELGELTLVQAGEVLPCGCSTVTGVTAARQREDGAWEHVPLVRAVDVRTHVASTLGPRPITRSTDTLLVDGVHVFCEHGEVVPDSLRTM